MPIFLPGYKFIDEDYAASIRGEDFRETVRAGIEHFEKAWGCTLNRKNGLDEVRMINAAGTGEIKCLYLVGTNPLVSNPDIKDVTKSLSKLDLLVVQDIFLTETAKVADVVLPACTAAEKLGTVVNTERRIQMVRPAIRQQGNSKSDFQIMLDIMDRFGYTNNPRTPEDTMKEISSLVPYYAGVSYEKIARRDHRHEGVRWPIAADSEEGTRFLHKDKFIVGKAKLMPVDYSPPNEETDDEYPMILTTGRDLFHFHTATMTGKSEGIVARSPYGILEINPADAKKLGLETNDRVRITSRRGTVVARAIVTPNIREGVVFSPFHHTDTLINIITNPAMDPMAYEPELKVCAVRLEKDTSAISGVAQ
jgi:predicted molibdopterin-dependent oxidoreductase YjgC